MTFMDVPFNGTHGFSFDFFRCTVQQPESQAQPPAQQEITHKETPVGGTFLFLFPVLLVIRETFNNSSLMLFWSPIMLYIFELRDGFLKYFHQYHFIHLNEYSKLIRLRFGKAFWFDNISRCGFNNIINYSKIYKLNQQNVKLKDQFTKWNLNLNK